MASPGAKGAIARYGADLLAIRDLVEQLRQNRAVALSAGGKLHRPDVAGRRVHLQLDLRYWRRRCVPCFLASYSPSPRNLIPVLSTSRFRGPAARRDESWTVKSSVGG